MVSCGFCEIKNIYFVEKLRTAASDLNIKIFFFFVLILRQNRYLPLNSDHLLGKQRTMLRYRSQPSKISYLRFGDVFYLFTCWISIPTRLRWYHRDWVCIIEKTDVSTRESFNFIQMKKSQLWKSLLFPALCFYIYGLKKYVSDF